MWLWHNPGCSQLRAYMTRSELKSTVMEQFLTSVFGCNLQLLLPLNLPARCCTTATMCRSLRENKFCCSAKDPQGSTRNIVVPCDTAKYGLITSYEYVNVLFKIHSIWCEMTTVCQSYRVLLLCNRN